MKLKIISAVLALGAVVWTGFLVKRPGIVTVPIGYTDRPPTAPPEHMVSRKDPLEPALVKEGVRSNFLFRIYNRYDRPIWFDYLFYEFRHGATWKISPELYMDSERFLPDEYHSGVVPPHSGLDVVVRLPDFDSVWRASAVCRVRATRCERWLESVRALLKLEPRKLHASYAWPRFLYDPSRLAWCYTEIRTGPEMETHPDVGFPNRPGSGATR